MKANEPIYCTFPLLFLIAGAILTSHASPLTGPSVTAKSQQIIERIDAGDRNAILELGNLGDPSVIAYLQRIASQPDKTYGSAACHAQMALAKLGHAESFQTILQELHSQDPLIQDDAVKKILYLGGNPAIRTLAGLLRDEKWRTLEIPGTSTNATLVPQVKYFPPLSHVAVQHLSKLVKNPPTQPGIEITENVLRRWRAWWDANQGKY